MDYFNDWDQKYFEKYFKWEKIDIFWKFMHYKGMINSTELVSAFQTPLKA